MISRTLSVAAAKPAHYRRNLIRQVVCELRFPTLFDLDSARPPDAFAKAMRLPYPHHQVIRNVDIGGPMVEQAHMHTFRSKDLKWTVTLRTAAISLETIAYDSFADMQERLALVLDAGAKVIDSEFFTRVGLRYINAVPSSGDPLDQWVNPVLVGPLGCDVFGVPENFTQTIAGEIDDGRYTFSHGLGTDTASGKREYVLDFDFSREDVTLEGAMDAIKDLHDAEFSLFSWALGPKALAHMGPSTLKKGATP